jgi:hypothetical protein
MITTRVPMTRVTLYLDVNTLNITVTIIIFVP